MKPKEGVRDEISLVHSQKGLKQYQPYLDLISLPPVSARVRMERDCFITPTPREKRVFLYPRGNENPFPFPRYNILSIKNALNIF